MKFINEDYTNANSSLSGLSDLPNNIKTLRLDIGRYTRKLKAHCEGRVVDLIKLRLDSYANALKTISDQVGEVTTSTVDLNTGVSTAISPESEVNDKNIDDLKEKIGILKLRISSLYGRKDLITGKIDLGYLAVCKSQLRELESVLKEKEKKFNGVKSLDSSGGDAIDNYKTSLSKITLTF